MCQEKINSKNFSFGDNWKEFLKNLGEHQIQQAILDLRDLLGADNISGMKFLDIGCGSGIHSLAARKMGAQVLSIDIDPSSVWCATELKDRLFPGDLDWTIERGSVLDSTYLESLGKFDIVYSWGVLHHTGSMWHSINLATNSVKEGGLFCVAIYNDQGWISHLWRLIKRLYNTLPPILQQVLAILVCILIWGPITIRDFIRFKPFYTWRNYYKYRGMSPWYDVIDWVGGYPYEVASSKSVIDFMVSRGFQLEKLIPIGRGAGNNQFVFRNTGK